MRQSARLALWAAFAALCAVVAYGLFLPFPRTSDMAATMLAGQDMAAGNWRLAGWWLPTDPFVTTDIPLYALLTAIDGANPLALYHAPALIWAAIATLGVAIARRPSQTGPTLRPTAATVLLLALPILPLTGPAYKISESPIHNGTMVLLLACFLMLDAALRTPHPARPVAAYASLLTLATIGDPMAIFIGAGPIIAASLLAIRRADHATTHRAICAATIGAIIAAKLLIRLNTATGGYAPAALGLGIPLPINVLPDLLRIARWLTQFLGADLFSHPLAATPATAIAALRAPLAALFLAALLLTANRTLRRAKPPPALLDQLLCLTAGADIILTALSGAIIDEASSRLIIPAFICGALLVARSQTHYRRLGPYLAITLAASALLTAGAILPPPKPAYATAELRALAADLAAHHATYGYGPYWAASITTALTGNQVHIGALWRTQANTLRPYPWLASATWFTTPALKSAPEITVITHEITPPDGYTQADVEALLGRPATQRHVGAYLLSTYPGSTPGLAALKP